MYETTAGFTFGYRFGECGLSCASTHCVMAMASAMTVLASSVVLLSILETAAHSAVITVRSCKSRGTSEWAAYPALRSMPSRRKFVTHAFSSSRILSGSVSPLNNSNSAFIALYRFSAWFLFISTVFRVFTMATFIFYTQISLHIERQVVCLRLLPQVKCPFNWRLKFWGLR